MSVSKMKKDKIVYINKCGFTLCQQNGQRTYGGPPPNWGSRPVPSRDCEVFIGRLPRICFEDELIPLFLSAGELYEFRLMLDFSGTNRGYGYAHYATPEGAQRAIEKLNKYEIRPGHPIGVLKSKNNCRLLFGNIGSGSEALAFNEFIRATTDQVLNVLMFKNFQQLKQTNFRISSEVEEAFLGRMPRNNGNNNFAIVEYENHKAAAVARRILIPKYGHVLAIDWAVPPRERKRFNSITDTQVQPIERPLPTTSTKDTNSLVVSKSNSKIRPVPVLLVQPSPLDNVEFMPKTFKSVVKFFKYQLSVCLYKSVDQLEIPLFICKEIERKIVDRITNLENCSQAVQLIFNYFSWYNEKKRFIINSDVQKLLQEVKMYADSFVVFVNTRLKYGQTLNPEEDHYYTQILPLQLNVLFRIILRSDPEHQTKLSSGITKGLKWLTDVMRNGNKPSREFINEIIAQFEKEDGSTLDKASTLAKSLFLNNITSQQPQIGNGLMMDTSLQKNVTFKNEPLGVSLSQTIGNQNAVSTASVTALQRVSLLNLNSQHLKGNTGHYIPIPFSQIGLVNEEANADQSYLPVPYLLIQSSIMNRVPFMPDIFNNVLAYFKHLIKISLNVCAWQLNIPYRVLNEIERKIVDRMTNMENCSEGILLILNYFSAWSIKHFDQRLCNLEAQKLLEEVKMYADSFVHFVWNKTGSVYIPNEAEEDYFCKVLPLRLNILFHMMLIFDSENSTRFLLGITKGLNWLDELIQKGDKTAKLFLEELTKYVIESDQAAYERAKNLGKVFCTDLMNFNGQIVNNQILSSIPTNGGEIESQSPSLSSVNSEILSGLSVAGSDNASDITLDF